MKTKKVLLTLFPVCILLSIVLFFAFVIGNIRENLGSSDHLYRVLTFENETVVTRITYFETSRHEESLFDNDEECLSFSVNGNYHIVSKLGLGLTDFECTGSCFCDGGVRRLGSTKMIVEKPLKFLVSSVTASLALYAVSTQLHDECHEELDLICDDFSSVYSTVDECKPILEFENDEGENIQSSFRSDEEFKSFEDEEDRQLKLFDDDDDCTNMNDEINNKQEKKKRINFNKLSTNRIIKILKGEEKEGKYRVLGSKSVRIRVRNFYLENDVHHSFPVNPKKEIRVFLKSTGELLSEKYERIVVGDHGAFMEISPQSINMAVLQVELGQRWRLNHPKCKYVWYESKNGRDKVYYQKNSVRYADYRIGFFYIDPMLVETDI